MRQNSNRNKTKSSTNAA